MELKRHETRKSGQINPQDPGHLKRVIRDIGLKITQQRLVILEQILKGRKHITAQEVFENVLIVAPDIGFATVYRFLRTLSEHGYVTEVRMRGLPARYEWTSREHHDHLTCVSCGKICEFENVQIEELQIQIAKHFDFELTDHILELYGKCGDCRVDLTRSVPTDSPPTLPTSRSH